MRELEKLLKIATDEVGYLEKASNSQLDSKTANAGDKNYTKYGRDMHNLYPSVMDFPAPWCDCFVDWCFYTAFGKDRAKELLCGDFNDYTPSSAQYFKTKNQFFYTPSVGDVIFFRNDTRICHTGLVYKVDNGVVYTIEGNTSSGSEVVANGGSVQMKQYAITNTRIAGYGRPNYKSEVEQDMMYGIDVSSNQGTIDFKKIKKAGVEFVVIRSTTKNNNPDTRLAEYVKGCNENGIPFAFYKYMYALSEESARIEATKVIWAIENVGIKSSKDITIYADVEDKTQFALTTATLTKVVNAFKEVVEKSGYSFGLYMSKSPYEAKEVDTSAFNDAIWLARYPSTANKTLKDIPSDIYKPKAQNGYLIGWQWSSKGVIDGISGYVDLDVFYGEIKKAEIETKYYATPEFTLIESLNKIGVYSSFANRKKIAIANGIDNYTGTAEQNLQLLNLLNSGKLKQA